MNLAALFLGALGAASAALAAPAPTTADVGVAWSAPESYLGGRPFEVSVAYTIGSEGAQLEAARLGPAAFKVNGKSLAKGGKSGVNLPAGANLTLTFDLAPALAELGVSGPFELSCIGGEPKQIDFFQVAPEGLNFMDPSQIPTEELADYKVLLTTTQGDMLAKMSPELAPNHVRNFLDLSYTGFYDGVQFHRVIPGFMIQGGDPNTKDLTKSSIWGTGNGPRMLNDEFSQTAKHVRGVLSMANTGRPNSASCQFFVMHAAYPSLDGKYSIFGKLESGFETLDRIVSVPTYSISPRQPKTTPVEPQKILSATVLYSPSK